MSTRITCPACGRSLLLPGDCTAEALSCPRCFARIPNPQAPVSSAAIQAETPVAAPPVATSAGVTERSPWPRAADVDVDMRRDSRGTAVILVVLAVLGGIGFLGMFIVRTDAGVVASVILILCVVLVVIILVVIIVSIWALVRVSNTPRATAIGTAFRTLLIIGLLGLLLVIAGCIFALVGCLVNPPEWHLN